MRVLRTAHWQRIALGFAVFTACILPSRGSAQGGAPSGLILTASRPLGASVGQTLTWTVGGGSPPLEFTRFRFRIGLAGQALHTVRDFRPEPSLPWTPMEEGDYVVQATIYDTRTGASTSLEQPYTVISPVFAGLPQLWSTWHPLVFLYLSPPRPVGSVRVRFRPVGEATWSRTHWRRFTGNTVSFLIAGMRPRTVYEVQEETLIGSVTTFGTVLRKVTAGLPGNIPSVSVVQSPPDAATTTEPVLLHSLSSFVANASYPIATDLQGRVIWYYRFPIVDGDYRGLSYVVRPLPAGPDSPGGTMLTIENQWHRYGQLLREIDLAGRPVGETNVEQVNRQLVRRGSEPIECFSHEALRLPDGNTAVVGYVVRDLPSAVVGDMVIVLSPEWDVVWTWNSFDHLDGARPAILDERWGFKTVCGTRAVDPTLRDWTHLNAVEYVPADGNLLFSLRHQDWVLKVDYRNGSGDGDVLWRLGPDGDFTLVGGGPDDWFSHQHDARWTGDTLMLFDNGNSRCRRTVGPCRSRGQVWRIDETTLQASLLVNADVGVYSSKFGTAQKLGNGNYHFLAGHLAGARSRTIEVRPAPAGQPPGAARVTGVLEADSFAYRAFRLPNLYLSWPAAAPAAGSGQPK